MTVAMPMRHNHYAYLKGFQGLAARPAGRGHLQGSLRLLAIYCLRSCDRRVEPIHEGRLAELYFKQCPGLVSAPDPRFMRVRRKPFEAWLLRNVERIAMTKDEQRKAKKKEESRRRWALIRDYADNGPHFHDPAHREAWERANYC